MSNVLKLTGQPGAWMKPQLARLKVQAARARIFVNVAHMDKADQPPTRVWGHRRIQVELLSHATA